MGGHGSGRRESWRAKDTAEGCLSLDVRWLSRQGLLTPGRYSGLAWKRGDQPTGSIGVMATADCLELRYTVGSEGQRQDVAEQVDLEWAPCPFGGRRAWLRCPKCDRRAAILYAPGERFYCRRCSGLGYASQRQAPSARGRVKSENIRERLGGMRGIAWPFPGKPKHMRRTTYDRLRAEARAAEGIYDAATRKWLDDSEAWLRKRYGDFSRSSAAGQAD